MIKESDLAALENLSKLGQQARNAATEHDLALTADFELKNKQLKIGNIKSLIKKIRLLKN